MDKINPAETGMLFDKIYNFAQYESAQNLSQQKSQSKQTINTKAEQTFRNINPAQTGKLFNYIYNFVQIGSATNLSQQNLKVNK